MNVLPCHLPSLNPACSYASSPVEAITSAGTSVSINTGGSSSNRYLVFERKQIEELLAAEFRLR
jgi:hypothetical protein